MNRKPKGQRRKRWIEESTLLRRMGADQNDGYEKQPQGKQREHELTEREGPAEHLAALRTNSGIVP